MGLERDTKRSSGSPDLLDLERDLPVTGKDVEALRIARESAPPLTFEEYFEFLAQFETTSEALASKGGPRGERPFELP